MNRCVKHGRRFCAACAFQTAIFPIEHAVYHYLPVFSWVGKFAGL